MSHYESKASSKISLNQSLLAIAIGVFFLLFTLRSEFLQQKILMFQLMTCIPLFITSILAYIKTGYRKKKVRWNRLGWITFILAYAFLANVIGILIGHLSGVAMALTYYFISWAALFIYSGINISYDSQTIKERILKDGLFILLQLFFGVLVVLGIY